MLLRGGLSLANCLPRGEKCKARGSRELAAVWANCLPDPREFGLFGKQFRGGLVRNAEVSWGVGRSCLPRGGQVWQTMWIACGMRSTSVLACAALSPGAT